MVTQMDGVPKPRIRHFAITVIVTLLVWCVVHWVGNRAPAFGAFIRIGEAVVIVVGAYMAFQEIRPRTHERRDGDRRHTDRRSGRR